MECDARYDHHVGNKFSDFAATPDDVHGADVVAEPFHEEPFHEEPEHEEPEHEEHEANDQPPEGVDDALKQYLNQVRKTKLLTAEEERELAIKIEAGDALARERMITANLRLVVSITKRYMNRGLPLADLIEEGNIGLMKAVERFQVSKECRFSTYATWWIRQSVERALINQGRTIRLPVHIADDLSRTHRMSHTLRRKLNREPTVAEIAEALGVEESHLRKLLAHTKATHSLHHAYGDDKDQFLIDTIEDTHAVSPATLSEGVNGYEKVCELMETLSENEKTILALRFGLNDQEPETLEEIGARFGVTRERIRQIEAKSLMKLRSLMKAQDQFAYC